ncbi:hypothetical protein H6776_02250 [Candidatus Nomurabacteria bacterium]|nr:hypothetical protein [Candidatus Nomurabacteria bacterium]
MKKKFELPIPGITTTYTRFVDKHADVGPLIQSINKVSQEVLVTSRESFTREGSQIYGLIRNQGNILAKLPTGKAFIALCVAETNQVILGFHIAHRTQADILTSQESFGATNYKLKALINKMIDEDSAFIAMYSCKSNMKKRLSYWCVAKGSKEVEE